MVTEIIRTFVTVIAILGLIYAVPGCFVTIIRGALVKVITALCGVSAFSTDGVAHIYGTWVGVRAVYGRVSTPLTFLGIRVTSVCRTQVIVVTQRFGPALSVQWVTIFNRAHISIISTCHGCIFAFPGFRVTRIRGTQIMVIAFNRCVSTCPGFRLTIVNGTVVGIRALEGMFTPFIRVTSVHGAWLFIVAIDRCIDTHTCFRITGISGT